MHSAVRLLYRDGVQIKGGEPLIGQIMSDRHKGVPLLNLWPLDWTANATYAGRPLAVLWQPVLVGIGYDDLVLRGLEAVPKGNTRRWVVQKWLCDLLDVQRARARLEPHCRFVEVAPYPYPT